MSAYAAAELYPENPTGVVRVVIIACSATKLGHAASAKRLYTGVVWTEWKKYGPPSIPCGWVHLALSAKHGLIESWRTIEPYEQKLTKTRAAEMAEGVSAQFESIVRNELGKHQQDWPVECVVIGGALYQELAKAAGLPVVWALDGTCKAANDEGRGGIGVLRNRVRNWAKMVRSAGNQTPHAESAWPGGGALLGLL